MQRITFGLTTALVALLSGVALATDEHMAADAGADATTDLGAAAESMIEESKSREGRATEFGLRKVFGAEARQADAFDGFARPVTNISFHHPFIWSELRPLFIYNWIPERSILDGGRVKVYAMQIHVALSERLQLTAYKDGYAEFDADVFEDDSGFVDIAVGLKYNFWRDEEKLRTFSAGIAYELQDPGDKDVFEGEGDGFFDLFGSYAQAIDTWHVIGTAGFYVPVDSEEDNATFHWHLHADYPVTEDFAPLVEINGFTYMSDTADRNGGLGASVPLGVEGFDYTTLGSGNVKGNDVITGAVGFRYDISDDVSFGAAWEIPLTSREGILDKRLTMDLVLRF